MSIYLCDNCDEQKDGDWNCPSEVGGDEWCEDCACDVLPVDWEDWVITFYSKPIPDRNHDWEAVHNEYDGAPIDSLDTGSPDQRAFTGKNVMELIEQINEYNEES